MARTGSRVGQWWQHCPLLVLVKVKAVNLWASSTGTVNQPFHENGLHCFTLCKLFFNSYLYFPSSQVCWPYCCGVNVPNKEVWLPCVGRCEVCGDSFEIIVLGVELSWNALNTAQTYTAHSIIKHNQTHYKLFSGVQCCSSEFHQLGIVKNQ